MAHDRSHSSMVEFKRDCSHPDTQKVVQICKYHHYVSAGSCAPVYLLDLNVNTKLHHINIHWNVTSFLGRCTIFNRPLVSLGGCIDQSVFYLHD